MINMIMRDESSFLSLTEKLAQHGKDQPEEANRGFFKLFCFVC